MGSNLEMFGGLLLIFAPTIVIVGYIFGAIKEKREREEEDQKEARKEALGEARRRELMDAKSGNFGQAHFATAEEIKSFGLMSDN